MGVRPVHRWDVRASPLGGNQWRCSGVELSPPGPGAPHAATDTGISMTSMRRLLLLLTLAFAVLSPAQAWAQGIERPDECFGIDTGTADGDDSVSDGDQVTTETSPPCAYDESAGGGEAGVGGGDGGVGDAGGGVGRIDAGAGAAAATGSASMAPWLIAAGAGVTGSVLRRRRR